MEIRELHKTVESKIVKFSLKCLVGGGVCDSILDNVDKLNNFEMSMHIGA